MRKALLALLLVPLFVVPVREPTHTVAEPIPPPAFPLTFDRSTSGPARSGVLLFPLEGHETEFSLTSAEDGVMFDVDGDGVKEKVAWPRAGTEVAFLALDLNGDGRITSGKELFRMATLLATFRQTGAPPSGSIHDGHQLYDRLLLWIDRNHDGRGDPAELTKVRDRFTAIGLGYTGARWADVHGNRIRFQGWMQARTAGPDQGEAVDPVEERARRRHYFDVALATTSNGWVTGNR